MGPGAKGWSVLVPGGASLKAAARRSPAATPLWNSGQAVRSAAAPPPAEARVEGVRCNGFRVWVCGGCLNKINNERNKVKL